MKSKEGLLKVGNKMLITKGETELLIHVGENS